MIPCRSPQDAADELLSHVKVWARLREDGIVDGRFQTSFLAMLISPTVEAARRVADTVAAGLNRRICDIDTAPLTAGFIGDEEKTLRLTIKLAVSQGHLLFVRLMDVGESTTAERGSVHFIQQQVEQINDLSILWSKRQPPPEIARRMRHIWVLE